ncbi:MAG TPA: hypothetical protein VJB12_01050 [Candidatus Nanoarchaeia archaeon]|nr:hypothetical protein [Candidatus Nanoarchaeia archaeon]
MAAKKKSRSSGTSSKRGQRETFSSARAHPQTLPKFQSKSVRIDLGTKTLAEQGNPKPTWRQTSNKFIHDANVQVHHYSAIGFLFSAVWGFVFALHFAAISNWLLFLISLALFIIGLDKFMFSLRKKKEVLGEFKMPTMESLHHFSAHIFLLFALIGLIFAITFWLKGQWLMLLFSAVVLILGVDNMLMAKRNRHYGTAPR